MSEPLAALLSLAMLGANPAPAQEPLWLTATPGYEWEFPRDHWSHPGYRNEWWYFTGQLSEAATGEMRFGYQFTFFRVGLMPREPAWSSAWTASDLIMGHAAITDLASGEHRFSELLYRATPFLGGFATPGDSLVAWSLAPTGSGGRWTLAWNGRGYDIVMRDDTMEIALELRTLSATPPVLQGDEGWSRKTADGSASSLYYSYPRLASRGTLALGGESYAVTGESWMDKEFGSSQLGERQVGWDWVSLRLRDGRSLMLYSLRREDGSSDWKSGTLIEADGSTRSLRAGEWSLEAVRTWKSPETGAEYPVDWSLEIPVADIRVRIEADLDDQENRSQILPGLAYWEGSVAVSDERGARFGRGYVELTGYGENSRPPHLAAPAAKRD